MATIHSIADCPPLPRQKDTVFRHCPNYLGYITGSDGTIWSCWKRGGRRPKGKRIMATFWHQRRTSPDPGGYPNIFISTTNQRKHTRLVHQLILEAFVGSKPDGMECCHANGVRADNRVENLRWDTRSNNQKDSVRHGTSAAIKRGEDSPRAKLTADDVRMIRTLFQFIGCNRIARIYDISSTHAKDINARRARTEIS